MRRSSSRSPEAWAAALACAALALLAPQVARAQACCAAASAIGVARLAPHEDAVVGVGARATWLYASMDRAGKFISSPAGTAEYDFEQDVAATLRVLKHGQITAVVPIVETVRAVPGLSDAGGGIGDLLLGARYDFIEPGSSPRWPGVALAWSLAIPTGRAPEAATNPLATDATGTGYVQAGGQLALERTFHDVFLHLSGTALWRAPRFVSNLHTQRGPSFTALAAVGTSFRNGLVGAVTASYTAELAGRLEGAVVPDSGYETTRLGIATGYPFSFEWRMQASLFSDLPVSPLSRNQPLGVGLSIMLLRAGW